MSDYMWGRGGRFRAMRLPSWQLALVLVVALALGIAIAVVATGVLLVALPVAAVIVLGYRLFGGRRRNGRRGAVIEGDYEVISGDSHRPGEPDRGRDRRR
jgi:hypothetical protein